MIHATTLHIVMDVNQEATDRDIANIRRFLEMEQDRIHQDFAFVFGMVPLIDSPTNVTVKRWKKPKKKKPLSKRIKKAYGL